MNNEKVEMNFMGDTEVVSADFSDICSTLSSYQRQSPYVRNGSHSPVGRSSSGLASQLKSPNAPRKWYCQTPKQTQETNVGHENKVW